MKTTQLSNCYCPRRKNMDKMLITTCRSFITEETGACTDLTTQALCVFFLWHVALVLWHVSVWKVALIRAHLKAWLKRAELQFGPRSCCFLHHQLQYQPWFYCYGFQGASTFSGDTRRRGWWPLNTALIGAGANRRSGRNHNYFLVWFSE